MRRNDSHSHICSRCGQGFVCGGLLWHNYDGHPEVVCREFHEYSQTECEACQEATAAEVDDKAEEAVV